MEPRIQTNEKVQEWKIFEKFTRAQIETKNARTAINENKRKIKIQKITTEIFELNKKIDELDDERDGLKHFSESPIYMGEEENNSYDTITSCEDRKEFFENVTDFAHICDMENMKTEQVYRVGGKWYTCKTCIPCNEEGNMDKSRTYFEKTEVTVN